MILQVGKLGKSYYDWIDEPVNRPLRLFRNDFIERLTRTNYVTVLVYWIPIVSYMVWVNFSNLVEGQRFKLTLSSFLLGMALWPLIEYVVHRWLFHSKPPSNWPSLLTLHFLIHGIHHKAPFDNGRLLFPPVPCSILFFVLYGFYTLIFPGWMLLATMAGTIAGYLCYDMTHYYLHYGSPKEGTYFYNMKRSHNNHHFANQTAGKKASRK
ncbi:hypothetical protein AAG570_001844 [Ranatra chinensis]|uniref:Fatty acid hydroxylase domain-containing protein n=1 Tax=Ranatra chinensis TaxID=642074 RepID=A0ABD0YAI9_9HEMI